MVTTLHGSSHQEAPHGPNKGSSSIFQDGVCDTLAPAAWALGMACLQNLIGHGATWTPQGVAPAWGVLETSLEAILGPGLCQARHGRQIPWLQIQAAWKRLSKRLRSFLEDPNKKGATWTP